MAIDPDGVQRITLLKPTAGHPRKSEGGFIQLQDGRILFVYSRFSVSGRDFAPSDLAGRYSGDDGRTWTREDTLILDNEGKMNTMIASLQRLTSGKILLFYARKNSLEDSRKYMRISTDEARTWSSLNEDAPRAFIRGYIVSRRDWTLSPPGSMALVGKGNWNMDEQQIEVSAKAYAKARTRRGAAVD